MENLLPDTLHRPVDSLTEGVFSFPIGEAPVVGCGVDCWVYRVAVMILRRRVVVSNWRSGLTHVARVAPAAILCALLTRDQ